LQKVNALHLLTLCLLLQACPVIEQAEQMSQESQFFFNSRHIGISQT